MAKADRDKYVGEPWERQAWDTPASTRAFNIYLAMGPERSLKRTSEEVGHSSMGTVEGWSADHDWQYRVMAWENHQRSESIEKLQRQTQEELDKFYDDQLNYLRALRQTGTRLLLKANERLQTLKSDDMTASDAASCARAGAYIAGYAERATATLLGIADVVALAEEEYDEDEPEPAELKVVG